jgi:hypothetical protein
MADARHFPLIGGRPAWAGTSETARYKDSECGRLDAKPLNSRELYFREMKKVTNREYRCFYPGHSFPPNEAGMPVQVNWYEALAYAAHKGATLPLKAKVDAEEISSSEGTPEKTGNLGRSISTWCEDMDVARDEKQFSFLSSFSTQESTRPCLAKGRSALLIEKRMFSVEAALESKR